MEHDGPPWTTFTQALATQRYFDAHDILEPEWLKTRSVRIQGAIWVAAAFHHWGRGNHTGVARLLKKLVDRAGPDDRVSLLAARWMREAAALAPRPGLTPGEIRDLVTWARSASGVGGPQ